MDEYIVKGGDTVQRLAVKFNCCPSDISTENKLSPFQCVLFEGQKLKIPKPRELTRSFVESSSKVNLRPHLLSHPGTVSRISAPISDSRSRSFDSDINDVSERQFIKLMTYRIVNFDTKPCSGTLLITPKFLVFDPERRSTHNDQNEEIDVREPICDVAVSVALDSVFSLNTYSKLSEIIHEKQIFLEDRTESVISKQIDFIDDEDSLYLVIKAIPLSDSYTGPLLSSAIINILHKNCKLFAFGIPKERVKEVYSFLISCIGAASNNNINVEYKEPSVETKRCTEEQVLFMYKHLLNTSSWEMVDNIHCSVVADALNEFEHSKFKPQYSNGISDILNDSMLEDLASNLPLNLNGCNLNLVYKTGIHGYSLGTIYRKMKAFDCATLLLIKDNSNAVFGAYMSDPFHISTHFYGTGETFVFHWQPDFKKYVWTRENSFFLKGDAHCFSIGAKSGHSAIWFEDTLKFGRSEPTDTFDNPTLCGHCKDLDRSHAEAIINSMTVDKSTTRSMAADSNRYFFVIDCFEVWRFSA